MYVNDFIKGKDIFYVYCFLIELCSYFSFSCNVKML